MGKKLLALDVRRCHPCCATSLQTCFPHHPSFARLHLKLRPLLSLHAHSPGHRTSVSPSPLLSFSAPGSLRLVLPVCAAPTAVDSLLWSPGHRAGSGLWAERAGGRGPTATSSCPVQGACCLGKAPACPGPLGNRYEALQIEPAKDKKEGSSGVGVSMRISQTKPSLRTTSESAGVTQGQ